MLILDTDHLTVIQRQSEPDYTILRDRLRRTPEIVCTTIVNVEEQLRGWLAVISRSRKVEQDIVAYRQLHALFAFFGSIPVVDFGAAAAARLVQLRRSRVRLGAMDLKIAAIGLAQEAVLLSRNLADFRRVPGLRVEDWIESE
jgi:tRNA(fMet)-specific endonuclease VapC